MAQYKLKQYCKSPVVGARNTKELTYCEFKEGDIVNGTVYKGRAADNIVPQLHVPFDGHKYAIPLQHLELIPNTSSVDEENKTTAQDIQDKTFTKSLIQNSKANINGILIGATVGLLFSWLIQSPNKWGYILGGGVLGGVMSRKKAGKEAIQELAKAKDIEEVKMTE